MSYKSTSMDLTSLIDSKDFQPGLLLEHPTSSSCSSSPSFENISKLFNKFNSLIKTTSNNNLHNSWDTDEPLDLSMKSSSKTAANIDNLIKSTSPNNDPKTSMNFQELFSYLATSANLSSCNVEKARNLNGQDNNREPKKIMVQTSNTSSQLKRKHQQTMSNNNNNANKKMLLLANGTESGTAATSISISTSIPVISSTNQSGNSHHHKVQICNQCHKRFNCTRDLDSHTFTEHGVYRCTFRDSCHVTFTQRSNLNRHALSHLPGDPIHCQICWRGFKRKDHCVKHLQEKHGIDKNSCAANIHSRIATARSLEVIGVIPSANSLTVSSSSSTSSAPSSSALPMSDQKLISTNGTSSQNIFTSSPISLNINNTSANISSSTNSGCSSSSINSLMTDTEAKPQKASLDESKPQEHSKGSSSFEIDDLEPSFIWPQIDNHNQINSNFNNNNNNNNEENYLNTILNEESLKHAIIESEKCESITTDHSGSTSATLTTSTPIALKTGRQRKACPKKLSPTTSSGIH